MDAHPTPVMAVFGRVAFDIFGCARSHWVASAPSVLWHFGINEMAWDVFGFAIEEDTPVMSLGDMVEQTCDYPHGHHLGQLTAVHDIGTLADVVTVRAVKHWVRRWRRRVLHMKKRRLALCVHLALGKTFHASIWQFVARFLV